VAEPNADYPLRLNTGRYRDQWHTMTRTGLSAKLSVHRREPLVEIHPEDAQANGLSDGSLARVSSAYGESIFRVSISGVQKRGEAFAPMHWSDALSGGGRTGRLAKSETDPHSGQPGFKDTPCRIEPVEPEWRAFLLSRDALTPAALYWSRARIAGGWLTELAGNGAIDFGSLLPEGMRSEAADIARGMRRIVVSGEDGAVMAALFVTRGGELPPRDWVERQFASGDGGIAELLAGRPAIPAPDRGPIVCVCHDVAEQQVRVAISEGAESVAEIGKRTCAGTNCGSCRPIIARMLDEAQPEIQEAAQ
jgi:assimilatory nitrate reductase catalytic subunit